MGLTLTEMEWLGVEFALGFLSVAPGLPAMN